MKRRTLGIFIALAAVAACLLFALPQYSVAYAVGDFSGGSGTASDPFVVSSARELDNIRNHLDGHFKLACDIDLAGYIASIEKDENTEYSTNKENGFFPIGDFDDPSVRFSGVLDGNGFTVSGFWTNQMMYNVGLFSSTYDAKIRNLTIVTAPDGVTGAGKVGIIAGSALQTDIANCRVVGNVRGIDTVGGIAGQAVASTSIRGCRSDITVTSYGVYAGGVAGFLSAASVTDCMATGDIKCLDMVDEMSGETMPTDHMYIGGIAGGFEGRQIKCSIFSGKITGADGSYGGIVGEFSVDYSSDSVMYTGEIVSSFYALGKDPLLKGVGNQSSLPKSVSADGFGKTDEQLRSIETYAGWDTDTMWAFDNDDMPYLQAFGTDNPRTNLLWLWIMLGILALALVCVAAILLVKVIRNRKPAPAVTVKTKTVYINATTKELPCNISPREREIAGYVLQGFTRADIANALYISEGTVKIHIKNLLDKADCMSQKEFIVKYK